VGESIPVHATAVGKLYLAFDPAHIEAAAPAAEFTPRTLADPAALRAEVELVRTRGWATNRDEWVEGLSVVAAPVRRARPGVLDGAVALAAASARLDALGVEATAARVLAAAASAAARLDGRVHRGEGRAA
jgi:DNA-binding IclR family transcriptional regulator